MPVPLALSEFPEKIAGSRMIRPRPFARDRARSRAVS